MPNRTAVISSEFRSYVSIMYTSKATMESGGPFTHCKCKDDPKKCKSRYPRDGEARTLKQPAVVCRGIAEQCDLPTKGARNAIGSMKGERNEEWVNGTHPACLVCLRCNSDVQVPYRIPITPATHNYELCVGDGCCDENGADLVYAAQVAQDSQCGYAHDYANKRGPVAVNEAKEMQKGMSDLGTQLRDTTKQSATKPHTTPYIFNRFKKRILSDSYGRGVARAAVETTNLLTQSRPNNVCAAETVIAGPITVTLQGEAYVRLVEKLLGLESKSVDRKVVHVDRRVPARTKLNLDKDEAFFYGYRGEDRKVKFLSAFEFRRLVDVVMPKLPSSVSAYDQSVANHTNEVTLTPHGYDLLDAFEDISMLEPGKDYTVKEDPPDDAGWLPFPAHPRTEKWRHHWIMRILKRPVVPVFAKSPLPRSKATDVEKNAMLLMVYFHPWTLIEGRHTERVPYAGKLKQGDETFCDAQCKWQGRGVESEDSLNYIRNFMNKTRTRASGPGDDADDNSDDLLSDDELVVSAQTLAEATETNVGGRKQNSAKGDQEHEKRFVPL